MFQRFSTNDLLAGATKADQAELPKPGPLALRPAEAARALGISPRTLWQLTKDGKVPHVRIGDGKRKTIIYPIVALQKWLEEESSRDAKLN